MVPKDSLHLSEYESKLELSPLALDILKLRYLNKNEEGEVVEKPIELFFRVASNIASGDKLYQRTNFGNEVEKSTKLFFDEL